MQVNNNPAGGSGGRPVKGAVEIREIVRRRKAYWHVWPEYRGKRKGRRILVGFQLGIFSTHDHSKNPRAGSCEKCTRIYQDLKRIALASVPGGERIHDYAISFFDPSLSRSFLNGRREVLLAVKLYHRHKPEHPPTDCEIKCLAEIKQKLDSFGSPQGSWQSSALSQEE